MSMDGSDDRSPGWEGGQLPCQVVVTVVVARADDDVIIDDDVVIDDGVGVETHMRVRNRKTALSWAGSEQRLGTCSTQRTGQSVHCM